jgi:hypothetical protein
MKKKYAVLAAAVLTGILITGCGQKAAASGWEANENSIYVSKGLEVESALIYTSEKTNDLYTQDGLASFVKEQIAAYNAAQGAAEAAENTEGGEALPVALKSCTLEGQTGKLIGDLPVDKGKVAAWFAGISLPLMAVLALLMLL